MTKKILAVVMGVLLVVSAFMFTACGSAFDGKYSEVTKEEVQTFANSVESNEIDKNANGIKLSCTMENKGVYGGYPYEENYSLSITTVVEEGKLQGEFKLKSSEKKDKNTEREFNIYVKDNTYYLNRKTVVNGEETENAKKSFPSIVNFDGIIDMLGLDAFQTESDYKLFKVISDLADEEGVKFYMDTTSRDVTKVKISLQQKEDATTQTYGDIYFLFDASKNLCGFKVDNNYIDGETVMKQSLSIELNSKGIRFPRDLDSYQA